jgi:hypothetical protein
VLHGIEELNHFRNMGKPSKKKWRTSLTPLDGSVAISMIPPGIRSVFLQANYGTLPDSGLQNGHIFYLLLSSKPLEVARMLQQKGLYNDCTSDQLRGKIQVLEGKGIKASKKLSNTRAMERYQTLCCEKFLCELVPRSSVQSESASVPPKPQDLTPGKTASPLKTRQTVKCTPSCREQRRGMKRKLDEVSSDLKSMRKRLKIPKKVQNQAVKRLQEKLKEKDRIITILSDPTHSSALAEVQELKKEIDRLKGAHRKLRFYWKKKSVQNPSVCGYQQIIDQNKEVILQLEAENVALKEKIEELQTELKEERKTKEDGKR